MPELPEITVYLEALEPLLVGNRLNAVRIVSPFLLRTFDPPLEATFEQPVVELRRLGKRIAIGLDNRLWLVLHLMIAGRLKWDVQGARIPGKVGLATFHFSSGTLILTESGPQKRASLHVVKDADLESHDPGGIEVLTCTLEEFTQSLQMTNRTLKRQLTNPMLFSGIGNAWSDEILHRARLSPIVHSQKLTSAEVSRLYEATRQTMRNWIERLREQTGDGFPKNLSVFRSEMAVHGRFGKPCPVCQSPVQRICYAENETNYCATCQTGGKVLADRSLSRLLKDDWPRRIEDWE